MGMNFAASRSRALTLTLCPLPQAGEGNVRCRAARDGFVLIASLRGALEWE
jgi:hypothetical protein